GYTGPALDMYGDGKVADHPDDAKAFMMAATRAAAALGAPFDAAAELLQGHGTVDAGQIAALGHRFGGPVARRLARAGKPLAGVVSYHGSLGTEAPAQEDQVRASVLVFTGEEDPMVPAEQVDAFEQEMQAANVDYELIRYPGAKHSFTNPKADEFGK